MSYKIKIIMLSLLALTFESSPTNYYQILGVNKDAGNKEIEKAYKAMILQPLKQNELKEIDRAYETLKDRSLRKEYDEHLIAMEALEKFDNFNKATDISTAFTAPEPKTAWTFELRNRERKPIFLTVTNGQGKDLVNNYKIAARSGITEKSIPVIRLKNINLSQPVQIIVKDQTNEKHAYRVTKTNKTIFVTWEDGQLRVQSGKNGKTQSGLSLSSNIQSRDIKLGY